MTKQNKNRKRHAVSRRQPYRSAWCSRGVESMLPLRPGAAEAWNLCSRYDRLDGKCSAEKTKKSMLPSRIDAISNDAPTNRIKTNGQIPIDRASV
jgi:hypothetical protein